MEDTKGILIHIQESLDDLKNSFKEYISTKDIEEESEKQNENIKAYIDFNSLKLIANNKEKQLTLNDCIILKTLLNKEEKLCTYQELCEVLYGCDLDESAAQSIRVAVCRLKAKIKGIIKIKNIRERGFIAFEVKKDEEA